MKLLPHGIWPGLIKNIAGAAGATINRSEAVPRAPWLLMFLADGERELSLFSFNSFVIVIQ